MSRWMPWLLMVAAGAMTAHWLDARSKRTHRAAVSPPQEKAPLVAGEGSRSPAPTSGSAAFERDDGDALDKGQAAKRDEDQRLKERIRSELAHWTGSGHAIQIDADAGRVVVTGEIASALHRPLIQAIRAISGVREVHDHLQAVAHGAGPAASSGNAEADASVPSAGLTRPVRS